ncbi:MAG: coproporphyrinogen-III oxidase family protein [Cellulosilyticaceae bacterium]
MFVTTLMGAYLTRSLKPFVFQGRYDPKLDFEHLGDLGLYVHIPFCKSICTFCPYCKVTYDQELAGAYKEALLGEIRLVGGALQQKKQVTSLYFGGGTPALMVDDLEEIIHQIKKYFDITGGIGVELHPRDLTQETIQKLRAAGVTMISIGVQSFDKECLEKIGREAYDLEQAMRWVREANFEVIDMDLIFAIPGQDEALLKADLEKAFSLGATQVSTYPFIDFTFASNAYEPMSHKDKKRMLGFLHKTCEEMGIERTSVWTFAQAGTKKYSSVTRDTFLGFGVSATTLLRDTFKINTFSIPHYIQRIESGELPTALTLNFTRRQRAVYYLFWGAYMMRIDPQKFETIVGAPLDKLYGFELWLATKLGFVTKSDGVYVLTDQGAYWYHDLEQIYTTAYIDKMWHIARKEAFPKEIRLK